MMSKKKSVVEMISAIIGSVYFVLVILIISGSASSVVRDFLFSTNANIANALIGTAIKLAFIIPSIAFAGFAMVFNWLSYGLNSVGFAITALILYCISGLVFLPYIAYLLPNIILSAFGIASISKIKSASTGNLM